jgi:RND family efflux transporter MFP subunit
MMTIRFLSIPLFMLLTSLLCNGCQQEQLAPPPPPPPQVTVAPPVVQDITNYIYFTGYTVARKDIELRARVEGYLEAFSFQPGAQVRKGDLLFSIDPKPFEAKVSQGQAELETKQAERELAEATFKRKESAYKEKAVSELAVLEAKAELSKATAQVKEAEAQLITEQLQLSYTKIHAPTDGRISRNLVDVGNLVGAGGDKTLLATLVNYDPIYVYFNMDERSLMLHKNTSTDDDTEKSNAKTPVQLELIEEKDYPHKGVADYLDNQVDLSTGTIQVRAIFNNSDLFIVPGLFAKVRIPYEEVKAALLVPESAISSDQRGRYLLTVNSDNTVEYKPIEIGSLNDGLRVITKGITAEDRVVVTGIQRARPGSKVTPVQEKLKGAIQVGNLKVEESAK